MKKLMIFVFILALFMLASCAGMRKDTLESDMDAAAEVGASANSYDVNTTPSLTADYLLGIDDFGEGSWAVQRFNISNLAALYWANPAFTGTLTIANGGDLRVATDTDGHNWSIPVHDEYEDTWRDAWTFTNGDSTTPGDYTNWPSITLGTNVVLSGLGAITLSLDTPISFGDAAVFIESDDDGYLDLDADTGIRLNAPTDVVAAFTANSVASDAAVSSGSVVLYPHVYSLDDPDNWDMTNLIHNATLEASAVGSATLDAVGSDTQIDFCIKTRGTGIVTLVVNAADTAFLDGVTETQDEDIVSDGTAGGMICCTYGGAADTLSCISDGTWDGATD